MSRAATVTGWVWAISMWLTLVVWLAWFGGLRQLTGGLL